MNSPQKEKYKKIPLHPSSTSLLSLYCSPLFSFVVWTKFFGSRDGLSSCVLLRGTRELLNAVKVKLPGDFFSFFFHFNLSQSLDFGTVSDFTLQPLQKQQQRCTCSCTSGFSPTSGKNVFFSCRFIKKFTGSNIQDLCPAESLHLRTFPLPLWVRYLVTEHLTVIRKKAGLTKDAG